MAIEMNWRTFEHLPSKDEGYGALCDAMEHVTQDGYYYFFPMEVLLSNGATAPASYYYNRPAWVPRDRSITAERMLAWRPDPKVYHVEAPEPLKESDPIFIELLSRAAERQKQVVTMYEERPIFHFTGTRNSVIGILETGFNHRVCKERMPFKGARRNTIHDILQEYGGIENIALISMVCFCDMDKSEMVAHREQYGKYAIGLKKAWAEANHVTPARYIHGESPDIRNPLFYDATDILTAHEEGKSRMVSGCLSHGISLESLHPDIQNVLNMLDKDIAKLCAYIQSSIFLMKEYEGLWTDRVTALPVKRVFYKEREWRSVQPSDNSKNLRFGWDDISDILVDTEDDVAEIVRCVQNHEAYQVADDHEIRSKISIMTSYLSK